MALCTEKGLEARTIQQQENLSTPPVVFKEPELYGEMANCRFDQEEHKNETELFYFLQKARKLRKAKRTPNKNSYH